MIYNQITFISGFQNVIYVPFMIVNFEGWSYFFRFSAERVHDFGSIWLMLDKVGLGLGTETSDVFAFVSLVVLCLGIAVLIWLAPTRPRVAQVSFLVVAAFLLTNKVYSPQFVLWLIPLAVLARPRWRDLIWWQAAEAVYFVAVWWYLVGTDTLTIYICQAIRLIYYFICALRLIY